MACNILVTSRHIRNPCEDGFEPFRVTATGREWRGLNRCARVVRQYLIVSGSSVDEIKATSAITLSDRGPRAACGPTRPLCSRDKCNSVRLCEIDCVTFCPRKRPTNITVRRISYFVVGHNAIIQTHDRPAACVRSTGSEMELLRRAGRFARARRRSLQIRSDFNSGREIRR